MGKGARRRAGIALAALLAALSGCAAERPAAGNNAECAGLLDQFDTYEFLPYTGGFNFRQMQLAAIRQNRCITLTRYLAGLEAAQASLEPAPTTGPVLEPRRAVHAGVVTNPDDAGRAIAFFTAQGYRARAVGESQLGTRVYVEARTLADVDRIISSAQAAGFVGPYLSRYVVY